MADDLGRGATGAEPGDGATRDDLGPLSSTDAPRYAASLDRCAFTVPA